MTKSIRIRAQKGAEMLVSVVKGLEEANIKPLDISVHQPSLDDVFLAVTGKKPTKARKPAKKGKK